MDRVLCQIITGVIEALLFRFLLAERTNNTRAGKILTGNKAHAVSLLLNCFEERHRAAHDQPQYQRHQRNNGKEYKRQRQINPHGHNHGANHQERSTDNQANQHSHCRLQLIDVRGHTGNECRRSEAVKFLPGQGVDVMEYLAPEVCANALRCPGCHGLARQR